MKLDKVKSAVYILAMTGFLTSVAAFLIKYFHSGVSDFSIPFGGLLIPAIVILILKLNRSNKNKLNKN